MEIAAIVVAIGMLVATTVLGRKLIVGAHDLSAGLSRAATVIAEATSVGNDAKKDFAELAAARDREMTRKLEQIESKVASMRETLLHNESDSDSHTAAVAAWARCHADTKFLDEYARTISQHRAEFEALLSGAPPEITLEYGTRKWKPQVLQAWLTAAEQPLLSEAHAWFLGEAPDRRSQWRCRYEAQAARNEEAYWRRARATFEQALQQEALRLAHCEQCPENVEARDIVAFVHLAEAHALYGQWPSLVERVPGPFVLEVLRQPLRQFPMAQAVASVAAGKKRLWHKEFGLEMLGNPSAKGALAQACGELFVGVTLTNPDKKQRSLQWPQLIRSSHRLKLSADRFEGHPPQPGMGTSEEFDIVDTAAVNFLDDRFGDREKYEDWLASRL